MGETALKARDSERLPHGGVGNGEKPSYCTPMSSPPCHLWQLGELSLTPPAIVEEVTTASHPSNTAELTQAVP